MFHTTPVGLEINSRGEDINIPSPDERGSEGERPDEMKILEV